MPLPDQPAGPTVRVTLDGVAVPAVLEVAGLKIEQEVVEVKEQTPDGRYEIRKLPGRWKSGEVTLTRGLTSDASLSAWFQDHDPAAASAELTVEVATFDGKPVARYHLDGCRMGVVEIGPLKAGAADSFVERVAVHYASGRILPV